MRNDGLMDSAPDHTVLIAILAVGGALIGALIAAGSADIRQRRQLNHDRGLKDLTELRSVLDEALIAFEEAINQVAWVIITLREPPVGSGDDKADSTVERMYREGFTESMKILAEDRDRVMVAGRRLAIRIGKSETFYETYASAIGEVIDSIGLMHDVNRRQRSAEAASDFEARSDELLKRLAKHRNTLVAEAATLVGSRLPTS
jgi:hypothetical protein